MNKTNNILIKTSCLIFIIIFSLLILAPLLCKHDPLIQNTQERFLKPSSKHYFGTDHFGRDIFARVLYGGRITLPVAFVTMTLTALLGMSLGILAALNQGKLIDIIIMRIVDALMAIPFTVIAMAVTSIFGRGLINILYLVVTLWWATFARYSRSLVLSIKNRDAIMAAEVLGASRLTIVFSEILPRIMSPFIVYFIFELASLITSLATLSFFGLGAQPPTPEWGSMLSEGKTYYVFSIHILLWPSIFIFFSIMGLNLLGEGLRDKYSPYEILEVK